MSGRVLKWAGIIVFIVTVSAMGLYLFTQDKLEEADQSASVIGAFIALSSLALTLYGTLTDRLARSTSTRGAVRCDRECGRIGIGAVRERDGVTASNPVLLVRRVSEAG